MRPMGFSGPGRNGERLRSLAKAGGILCVATRCRASPSQRKIFPNFASQMILQHCLKYRLKIAGRGADYLKHLRRCCLLVKGFLGLVEQSDVFDRDQRLVTEGFGLSDVSGTESIGSFSGQREQADTLSTAKQR